jgi:hypothetical protein
MLTTVLISSAGLPNASKKEKFFKKKLKNEK